MTEVLLHSSQKMKIPKYKSFNSCLKSSIARIADVVLVDDLVSVKDILSAPFSFEYEGHDTLEIDFPYGTP